MKDIKGFTLLELLVVVLIIGILASIALPQYRKSVFKSRAARAMVTGKAINDAQKRYFLEHGEYTHEIDNLDIEVPCTWSYFGVSDTNGSDIGQMDCQDYKFFMYSNGMTSVYINDAVWINIYPESRAVCSSREEENLCEVIGAEECNQDSQDIYRCPLYTI